MEKVIKHMEFDDNVHSIKDILKDFLLPVVVKAKTQCVVSEKTTIHPGDVVTIHGKKKIGVLKGKDCKGRSISLVTICPHQVQLALPEEERIVFKSLKELCNMEGRPKFVEVTIDTTNTVETTVCDGERLKVLLVEKGANGPLLMHFRNEKGKHVRLPVDLKASFTACPADQKEYFINEIASVNKAPLALFVQFSPCEEIDFYKSLGVIEILEQSSVELLYMTLKDEGKYYCCVTLSPVDLDVQVPTGLVNKTEEYKMIQNNIKELINVDKFDAVVGSLSPLEWSPNILLPLNKVFPKKKKDKAKKKVDGDKLSSLLANETDENLSEIENLSTGTGSIDLGKKKKRFTLFKEGHDKAEKKENAKKDDTKAKDVGERNGKEIDEHASGVKNNEKKSVGGSANVKVDVSAGKNSPEPSQDQQKKLKEEKKKMKIQKEKEKKEQKEMKKKKRKEEKEHSKQDKHEHLTATINAVDGLSSEPNSPVGEYEDEYEMPIELLKTVEAEESKHKSMEAEESKHKSMTLISRTWKKMKKRKRAMSASKLLRTFSDTSSDAKNNQKGHEDMESPPPLLPPDYGECLYEEIPGEFMSQDIYEEAIRAYGAYETPVSPELGRGVLYPPPSNETGDSGFDENDQKAIDNIRESSNPPPLPGNHPVMKSTATPRRGSSVKSDKYPNNAVDSLGFKKFYESLKASEAELRSWGPEEIEKVLKDLQLHKYIDKFIESQVDGSLLIELDEAVLRDLGLNLFEARKLRKFVFGWRPDSSRDVNHYEKYDKLSKNPSHWNVQTVAWVLRSELGMNEFAQFCTENQVNGDLLRDVVVDDELLKWLLAGKDMRLNSVKLKNFVLEGWRPQKKKSIACSSSSSYEEPLPQVPTSLIPAETETKSNGYEDPVTPSGTNTRASLETKTHTGASQGSAVAGISNKGKTSGHAIPTATATPGKASSSKKQSTRKTSAETMNFVESTGGVNSLMQKYEQKSNTIGGMARRGGSGASGGKKSEPTSPSGTSFQSGFNRTQSDAPSVANRRKMFSNGK